MIINKIDKIKEILILFIPPILLKLIVGLKRKSIFHKFETLLIDEENKWHLSTCVIEKSNDIDFPNLLKITRNDYEFPFYLRNNTSDVMVYSMIINLEEYSFITSNEPKVIIDAGANIGLSSIYFASKYPNAKIISIEPEENNFKLLKINTQNYPNINIIQAALWDNITELELLDTGIDNWGFMTDVDSNFSKISTPKLIKKHKVETVTLDCIIRDYDLKTIDILKLDIEGAEKEVFENHDTWINYVQSIIVELHERYKPGCEIAFNKIAKKFDQIAISGEDIYLSKSTFIKMK